MLFSLIKAYGEDVERFLHSQSTLNIKDLASNFNGALAERTSSAYTAFLSPKAEIRGLVYLVKSETGSASEFFLISESGKAFGLKEHLEKFIIFDDVFLSIEAEGLDLQQLRFFFQDKNPSFLSENIILEDFTEADSLIKLNLVEKYFPKEKGCFPGQEVLSKFIHLGLKKRKERSLKYVEEARDLFTRLESPDYTEVKKLIEKALKENPKNEDAYELLGVVLARENNFSEAIVAMQKLEELNPALVMAKTNLSIFYMRLGDKEKAEEYKAKATVAQFDEALQKSSH